jgi:DNA-directed RNA polymerase subunit RPC12/RpoP
MTYLVGKGRANLDRRGIMPRQKKPMGRPARPLPPRIDATAEEIARVFMRTPPPGPEIDEDRVYRCEDCGRAVNYPDILYRDGRCADHTSRPLAE